MRLAFVISAAAALIATAPAMAATQQCQTTLSQAQSTVSQKGVHDPAIQQELAAAQTASQLGNNDQCVGHAQRVLQMLGGGGRGARSGSSVGNVQQCQTILPQAQSTVSQRGIHDPAIQQELAAAQTASKQGNNDQCVSHAQRVLQMTDSGGQSAKSGSSVNKALRNLGLKSP